MSGCRVRNYEDDNELFKLEYDNIKDKTWIISQNQSNGDQTHDVEQNILFQTTPHLNVIPIAQAEELAVLIAIGAEKHGRTVDVVRASTSIVSHV